MSQDTTRTQQRLPISILLCFNIVFAICGGAVVGLGVIILRDNSRQLLFRLLTPGSGVIGQIGLALLGIGTFGFLTAILGCSGAARKCSIGWYIFCVVLVLIAEVALGVSFLFFHDAFGKGLDPTTLLSKIHASYGVDPQFSQSIDYAQNKFNCCGSQGDGDYEKSVWRNSKLGGSEVTVPWTCCPLNEAESHFPSYMNPIPMNATACQESSGPMHKGNRFREGCFSPVEKWFRKEALTFLLMGLILFLLQVASLMAAICLCGKIK